MMANEREREHLSLQCASPSVTLNPFGSGHGGGVGSPRHVGDAPRVRGGVDLLQGQGRGDGVVQYSTCRGGDLLISRLRRVSYVGVPGGSAMSLPMRLPPCPLVVPEPTARQR